jgi:antitoxin component YwqK of YwqJK toxin-antitoxin module
MALCMVMVAPSVERKLRAEPPARLGPGSTSGNPPPAAADETDVSDFSDAPVRCPTGTRLVGAAPPAGKAQWCEKGNHVKHGPYVWWWTSDQKREQGDYQNGKKHGLWISLPEEVGGPLVIGRYVNGVPSGRWRERTGRREQEDENGVERTFFNREIEKHYRNGVLHGPYSDSSNDEYEKGFYVNGKREGIWEKGSDSGNNEKTTYRSGLKQGPFESQDSEHITTGAYHADLKHGVWKTWAIDNTDGEKRKVLTSSCAYSAGKKHGLCETFDIDGRHRSSEQYVAGKRHGLCKSWDKLGRLEHATLYAAGRRSGKSTQWYSNGRTKRECTYQDDVEHGPCTEWYEDGKLKARGGYVRGKKHGRWELFDGVGDRAVRQYVNGQSSSTEE